MVAIMTLSHFSQSAFFADLLDGITREREKIVGATTEVGSKDRRGQYYFQAFLSSLLSPCPFASIHPDPPPRLSNLSFCIPFSQITHPPYFPQMLPITDLNLTPTNLVALSPPTHLPLDIPAKPDCLHFPLLKFVPNHFHCSYLPPKLTSSCISPKLSPEVLNKSSFLFAANQHFHAPGFLTSHRPSLVLLRDTPNPATRVSPSQKTPIHRLFTSNLLFPSPTWMLKLPDL